MHASETWWIVGWVLSNTLIGVVLGGLAYACDRFWKRPALSHALWVLVLVKLLTPPIVTLPIPVDPTSLNWLSDYQLDGHQTVADSRDNASLSGVGIAFGAGDFVEHRGAITPVTWFLGLWIFGAVSLAWWIGTSARRLRNLIARYGRMDAQITARVKKLAGNNQSPPVWLVDAVISPMLVGAGRRTRIIFPTALWQNLDEDARELLLTHELEHWRRRDSLVRYLEAIAWVVLWWHPLVWVARRQIENCEERCCDLAASTYSGRAPRLYAEAILATLDFLSEPTSWHAEVGKRPVASGIGRLPLIEQRLRGIMSATGPERLGKCCRVLIVVTILVLPFHPALVFNRGTISEETSTEVTPVPGR